MRADDSRRAALRRGRQAEAEGEAWLVERGYRILERNWSRKCGEIDLICEFDNGGELDLVFVEIRDWSENGWVDPIESLSHGKRLRNRRAAELYLMEYGGTASGVRFDVLVRRGGEWTHWPGAWFN